MVAETVEDPFRNAPRTIAASVVAAGVSVLLAAAITPGQLGPVADPILLTDLAWAMFVAGTMVVTACSQQVSVTARLDWRPASGLMRRVGPNTPTTVAATVPNRPRLIYGGTVIPYLVIRKLLGLSKVRVNLERFEYREVQPIQAGHVDAFASVCEVTE